MIDSVKEAFLIYTVVSIETAVIRESNEIKNCSSLPDTLSVISVSSVITSGRAFKLCGAIGVTTKLATSGVNTGPPQLKE